MQILLLLAAFLLALASPVMAGQAATQTRSKFEPPPKVLPLKDAASTNACAAYGPGFVKLSGTDTCIHVGGSISIGAGGWTAGR
jgi:hypothetical protein